MKFKMQNDNPKFKNAFKKRIYSFALYSFNNFDFLTLILTFDFCIFNLFCQILSRRENLAIYFPIQKFEKIRSKMSSVVVPLTISPKQERLSRKSIVINSSDNPFLKPLNPF